MTIVIVENHFKIKKSVHFSDDTKDYDGASTFNQAFSKFLVCVLVSNNKYQLEINNTLDVLYFCMQENLKKDFLEYVLKELKIIRQKLKELKTLTKFSIIHDKIKNCERFEIKKEKDPVWDCELFSRITKQYKPPKIALSRKGCRANGHIQVNYSFINKLDELLFLVADAKFLYY